MIIQQYVFYILTKGIFLAFSVLQIGYIVSLFLTIIILFKVIKTYRRRYLIVDVADLNRKTKVSFD